jgi:translation initiation factor 2B subunit (eIF-2B alpha/beta/delta family)
MSTDEPQDEKAMLLDALRPEESVARRLTAFAELGLESAQVRQAVSVSPEALRLWAKGGTVRRSNSTVIDNIGRVARILLRGVETRVDVVRWLSTPGPSSPLPPLELIRDQPEAVLAAAEAHVAGRGGEERELLMQAIESRNRAEEAPPSNGVAGAEITDASSTQVKRHLLARLQEITANHASAREAKQLLEARHELAGSGRHKNYEAYTQFRHEVLYALEQAGDAPAEIAISELLVRASAEEEQLRKELADCASRFVDERCKTILTYSMSMRVIQALWGVSKARQAECTLYVAEGRVKSIPHAGELPPFADAAEILRFLESTRYDYYVIPDAVAPSLVSLGRVDLVVLGAQKVFVDANNEPTHFIATAGTDAILRAARDKQVKVKVLAEESKVSSNTPGVDHHERMVPLSLPSAGQRQVEGYARLMMLSAELCNIREGDENAIGNPSIIERVGRRPTLAQV